ncbi:MAG: hypothetical protein M9939_24210 [Mesorhizobium sp.]|nr:hypothetical protein [Mesorhizobium sp.]MCO5164208.1 hypothetical protein [Mesorhizobium sp.]
MSSADVWQEFLLVNPQVSVGVMGINAGRTVETAVVSNILALMTRPKRMAVADARFRQAQLKAAEATLRLAADRRREWIEAVAAWEKVAYLNRSAASFNATMRDLICGGASFASALLASLPMNPLRYGGFPLRSWAAPPALWSAPGERRSFRPWRMFP